jgi:hypothetical protein
MILHPEKFADRGCWISDDRVYAFVSAAHHCVAEIGYHGPQPVSRNSRVFVGRPAVLEFSGMGGNGKFSPILFDDFDWFAGGVRMKGRCGSSAVVLELLAAGAALVASIAAHDSSLEAVRVKCSHDSLFRNVHGERTWGGGTITDGWWTNTFHDRILLNGWLKQTGPYAGDFLIPETLRRKIFARQLRSGHATIDDLRPEYRDTPLPVYDVEIPIRIGGAGYMVRLEEENVIFTSPLPAGGAVFPPLCVQFENPEEHGGPARVLETTGETRERYHRALGEAPELAHSAHPVFADFFSSVPALVESCIIREYRTPRATPGRYYWIWAWDAMVTSLAALRWGAVDVAQSTVEFVDTHRDQGDLIPMRWTRALEPLDTQPRGALEALLASLASMTSIEMRDRTVLDLYPRLKAHLHVIMASSDPRGLFANIGFYPDLPLRFGRTESSAVALEVACFYTFCRTIENIAHLVGDRATAGTALNAAFLLEKEFIKTFWDGEAGFLADAIDLPTGTINLRHPLFSLLFLHSPLGWALVRERIGACADFIARHLLTADGMRVLPAGESFGETISNAWYPHWDLYALKILRRAGRAKEILRWLTGAERLLEKLGFCPEYFAWGGTNDAGKPSAPHHGAPSNLNCVTGWYQAFLEGVVGLEPDPGGFTIIPLGLPIGDYSLRGISYHGTRWNVTVSNRGKKLQSVRVDGTGLRGSLKIPRRFSDGGEHALLISYGEKEEDVLFREITNAEVLEVRAEGQEVEVGIRALGRCDVIFSSPGGWRLLLDGEPIPNVCRLPEGTFAANLAIVGEHRLRLTNGGRP